MARLNLPTVSDMTAEQRTVHEEAARGRQGRAPAPLAAWIRNPELARRAQGLGELLRYETSLSPRLTELAILVTARHWTSHYEWKAHKQAALNAGLPEETIASIATRKVPSFETEAERVVYEISVALLTQYGVPAPLYEDGVRLLSETGLVDLVGVLGYYALVSMTLNTFEIGLPDHRQDELDSGPLAQAAP